MRLLCALMLITVGSGFAADLTGKWKGEIEVSRDGETRTVPAFLNLKQEGNTVTGSGGPNEDRTQPLTDVKLEGTTLSFKIAAGQDTEAQMIFKVEVSGEEIKGTVSKSDEPDTKAKISVKRVQ